MFLIKLHRNKFHFDKRHFSNIVQCEGGGGEGRIKTVVDKRNRITRKTERGEWESVIGLEVHAQINANTKGRFHLVLLEFITGLKSCGLK